MLKIEKFFNIHNFILPPFTAETGKWLLILKLEHSMKVWFGWFFMFVLVFVSHDSECHLSCCVVKPVWMSWPQAHTRLTFCLYSLKIQPLIVLTLLYNNSWCCVQVSSNDDVFAAGMQAMVHLSAVVGPALIPHLKILLTSVTALFASDI